VNKTAPSAALSAKCILLHAYSHATTASSCREHQQKLHIAYSI